MEWDMKASLNVGREETHNKIYLGNIHGDHIHDGYAGAVFDIEGLAPALTTCQGGGREPHIIVYERTKREENR